MKQLQENFDGRGEVKGFKFKQEMKTELAFMYSVTFEGSKKPHYEVFQRRINALYDCESYPSSKAFGIWAKSVVSKEKAIEYFNKYNNKKA